jgi:hypothetical protein
MNLNDVQLLLEALGTPQLHYAVNAEGAGNNWFVRRDEGGKWLVAYTERGKIHSARICLSENEAAATFLSEVLASDPAISKRIVELYSKVTQ